MAVFLVVGYALKLLNKKTSTTIPKVIIVHSDIYWNYEILSWNYCRCINIGGDVGACRDVRAYNNIARFLSYTNSVSRCFFLRDCDVNRLDSCLLSLLLKIILRTLSFSDDFLHSPCFRANGSQGRRWGISGGHGSPQWQNYTVRCRRSQRFKNWNN